MSFVNQFFISDTHFSHDLMLLNRPFSTLNEMDYLMISSWNDIVRDEDIVWHLGDFSFADEARTFKIFRNLRGRKRLILGNHDLNPDGSVKKSIRNLPWDEIPKQMANIRVDGEHVILCHYAMRDWPGKENGSYHFHGHSHGRLEPYGRSKDVGVDLPDMAFCPTSFQTLKAIVDFANAEN